MLVIKQLRGVTRFGTSPAPSRPMIRLSGHPKLASFCRLALMTGFGLAVSAGVADAQRPVPARPKANPKQQSGREQIIPPAFYPPAGMCRIWINEVPAGQQSAPTDCASA